MARRPRRRIGVLAVSGAAVLALGVAAISPAAAVAPADDAGLPASFPVAGAGFGHGVGMSQWGAYGMAKAGYDAAGIATYYYQGTTVTPVQDDMDIRVNLLYKVPTAAVRSEALDPSGGAIEVTVGGAVVVGGPGDEFRFAAAGGQVSVQRVTGGAVTELGVAPSVTIRWAGTRTPGTAPGGPTQVNIASTSGGLASEGHRYRFGFVEVLPAPSGPTLNVVNSVRLHDEYLYGISEVSSSWPVAAQQAQVLAARTYALAKLAGGVRRACACHVDDGGGPYSDQTFTGWVKATAAKGQNWVDAVNATAAAPNAGMAILYNGQPITAFYSASSGGYTQASADAWGGALPYAVSVADPWSLNGDNPNRAWTVDVGQARMASIFGLPAVSSVVVSARTGSGTVATVTATAPDGTTATRTGPTFANALGLKSRYITAIAGNVGAALPTAPAPATPAVPAAPTTPAAPAAPAAPASTVVQRTVSLTSPATLTVKKGKRFVVKGVVRPGKARLKTWLQVQKPNGEWVTKERTRTNAKGHYRFRFLNAAKAGKVLLYRVLVVKKATVVGVSPQVAVTSR